MANKQRNAISGVLVTNKSTGEQTIYRTAEDAARATGVSAFIIRHACKEESHHSHRQDSFEAQYALNNGALVKRQRCKYCPYDFTDAKLKIVAAYSLEDSRVAVSFATAKECIDYLGISTNTYYLRRAEVLENMRKAGVDETAPKYMYFSDTVRGKDGKKWYLRFFDNAEGLGVLDPFVLPVHPKADPPASDVVEQYNAENNIDEDTQQYCAAHPDDVVLQRAVEEARDVVASSDDEDEELVFHNGIPVVDREIDFDPPPGFFDRATVIEKHDNVVDDADDSGVDEDW